ncbi:MAG: NifB/NifX family molybdenum-iron cluster-binding protein [Patescibacteria group bacterium]|nr:NifB/NifX family molybdenum-iron cluster-binding protein [Patescibacteria group bacterium]
MLDEKQKIFIPLLEDRGVNSKISLHFGHAPYFGLYDLATKELVIKENVLDHSDSLLSPVDQIIKSADPTIVFALDMGRRAINLFTEKNVSLKTGPYQILKEVLDNIDNLADLSQSCGH